MNDLAANPEKALRDYPLFVREGKSIFAMKLKDEGVRLMPEGLVWWINGEPRQQSYKNVAVIKLITQGLPKMGLIGICQIMFRDGTQLTVLSSTAHGMADPERSGFYKAFAHDLHAHLAPFAADIDFQAGAGGARHKALGIVLIIATLFFIGGPLLILLSTGDTRGLKFLAAGAFLLYFPFRAWKANKPRFYKPSDLPADVLL